MINLKNRTMFQEAQKAAFQPNIILLLVFIVIMFLGAYILPQVILDAVFENSNVPNVLQEVSYLFATMITTITAILYCIKIEKRSLRSIGFYRTGFLRKYLLGYLFGILMLVATVGICSVLGAVIIVKSEISAMVILFFFGYVIQGMSEEVALRGCLMISASNKVPIWVAVIISSLFFTIPHFFFSGFQILYSINVLLMGVFFALYIIRTDNIMGACGLHAGFNFFGRCVLFEDSICSFFTVSSGIPGKEFLGGNSYGYTAGFVMTVVIIVAILLVTFLPQKNLISKN